MGTPYVGVLYAGLMLTNSGPKLIEYNVRFGDPETQVLLMRLKDDILTLMLAACDGTLDRISVRWHEDTALTVVMAAHGYPGDIVKGSEIRGLDAARAQEGVEIFHAGTSLQGDRLIATGGRVLNVTALGKHGRAGAEACLCGRRCDRLAGRLLPARHRLARHRSPWLMSKPLSAGLALGLSRRRRSIARCATFTAPSAAFSMTPEFPCGGRRWRSNCCIRK